MEGILVALAALTPLNVALSIFGGFVFGFVFRNIYFHTRTIFLSLMFVIAFSVGRFLFVGAAATASGAGLLGTILFLIYLVTALVTRKLLGRKHKY